MIIGVIGPKRSGKSTTCQYLVEKYGFVRTAFADPLKRALMVAFGLTYEQVYGDEKDIPTDKLFGRTPRFALKLIGQVSRDGIHENIWFKRWDELNQGDQDKFVEDIRYPNEHTGVKDRDGIVISVRRPGCEYSDEHESESHSELPWDFRLINDGTIEDLKSKIDEICNRLGLKPVDGSIDNDTYTSDLDHDDELRSIHPCATCMTLISGKDTLCPKCSFMAKALKRRG